VSAIVVVYRLKEARVASDDRVAQLQDEIAERLHDDAFNRLGLTPLGDRLGAIDHLPYLSAALKGTYLEAALRGASAADADVAGAIGRLLA
jgi:hypothetical protein